MLSTTVLFIGFVIWTSSDQQLKTVAAGNAITNMPTFKVDLNLQEMIDSWTKGAATNGLVCGIDFSRPDVGKNSPTCYVNVINITTNWVRNYLDIPLQGAANIELLDSQGKPVEKTETGKEYGIWTDKQITDWRKNKPKWITFMALPLEYSQVGAGFSIPQTFKLKDVGEYTLHVHVAMRPIQGQKGASGEMYYPIQWLPEVVGKVQIRSEDIQPENLLRSNQTNSLTK